MVRVFPPATALIIEHFWGKKIKGVFVESPNGGPYRGEHKFIIRANRPLNPPDQFKQHHLHFQQSIPLSETLPAVRIKRNHMPLDGLLSDLVHDFFRVGAPSLGDELSCCWSPHLRIGLYTMGVPADKGALGDVDGAA